MRGLRILITNNTLGLRAGSELYVRDVATALLARGHTPIAYSTELGAVATELRAAAVPVIDDLDALGEPPDVVHGQHHFETLTAMLRFPGVPGLFVCHGWAPWQESPPRLPRLLRYVAVDDTCRDRLVLEHGIPEDRVRVLLNFVDLDRFRPRAPLPPQPRRALVFSNMASDATHLPAAREACARHGIAVDVVGWSAGTAHAAPEEILGGYDLVFAKGRAALEAMAVGSAVVLCDMTGAGELVTSESFDRLRRLNFGIRALRQPVTGDGLAAEIGRYDANDAAAVSHRVRAEAGRDAIVDEMVALYEAVIAEHAAAPPDPLAEMPAAAADLEAYGRDLKRHMGELEVAAFDWRARWAAAEQQRAALAHAQAVLEQARRAVAQELEATAAARDRAETAHAALAADARDLRERLAASDDRAAHLETALGHAASDLAVLRDSTLIRVREHALAVPVVGTLVRLLARTVRRLEALGRGGVGGRA